MSKLGEYKKKRAFNKTSEPSGSIKKSEGDTIFVIQKHAARALHYDFRIESSGVLISWAVPKGPSTDPSVKRLAVMTEDHPLDYASFEGVIPEGEYGGGPVIVWDTGTYKNTSEKDAKKISVDEAIKFGLVEMELKGKKLKGGYALKKMHGKNWLLIKKRDDFADKTRNPVEDEQGSVLSSKTVEEIGGK